MRPQPSVRPKFRWLDVTDTPQGISVRPKARGRSLLVEAMVWLASGAIAALMLGLGPGGSWVRVVGALLLVPIGLRAVVRTVRFLASPSMRQLSISWNVPRPSISGPFETIALDDVTRFEVGQAAGDLCFSAHDVHGKITHLVTLEQDEADDYGFLATWLRARPGPR